MMLQFTQLYVDTDPWNSSGHFPSSFQQTWGECPRFTAFDWSRRGGHIPERQQSTLGHCPPQSTSGHCPSQGYSFYPAVPETQQSTLRHCPPVNIRARPATGVFILSRRGFNRTQSEWVREYPFSHSHQGY